MGQTAFRSTIEVKFGNGQTTSEPVDLAGNKVAAIYVPAGNPATAITFEATPNPGAPAGQGVGFLPFGAIFDDLGVQYSAVVSGGTVTALDQTAMALAGPRYIRLVVDAPPSGDASVFLLTTN